MKARIVRIALLVLLAAVAYGLQHDRLQQNDPEVATPPPSAFADGEARVVSAFAREESNFVTDIEAQVTRLLADDEDGDRHQRFVLELAGGQTLLVSHNIDLAPRVPVEVGDSVRIRGEYEYNPRGGVLHWTHRAGDRKHEDGWIEHEGVRYW